MDRVSNPALVLGGYPVAAQQHDAVVILVEYRVVGHHAHPGADADVSVGDHLHQVTASERTP